MSTNVSLLHRKKIQTQEAERATSAFNRTGQKRKKKRNIPGTQSPLWAKRRLFCGRIANEGVRQVKACPKTDTCSLLSGGLLSQPADQCDLSEVTHLLSDLRVMRWEGGELRLRGEGEDSKLCRGISEGCWHFFAF